MTYSWETLQFRPVERDPDDGDHIDWQDPAGEIVAQEDMGDVIADAARRGLRVVLVPMEVS